MSDDRLRWLRRRWQMEPATFTPQEKQELRDLLRKERARQAAACRREAYRSAGMTRTKYGWE